jgi:predicted phage terminase large subunit-like protein
MKQRRLYLAALRELAKGPYSLEGCLAYGELVTGLRPWPHHRELVGAEMEAVATGEDTLILEPAGAAKTTWGNTIFASYTISKKPNIRIGLFSQTSTFADSFSRAIMRIYEENEEHRYLFGDLVNGGRWTPSEWIRKGSNVGQSKDLTLFAGGTNGQVASKRFDILLLDDVLGKENTETPDQREKARDWFDQTLYPRLVAQGVCIAFGTRWAPADLYQTLMDPIIPASEDTIPGYAFRTIVRQALITPDPEDESTWRSYWEEVWPLTALLKRRARNRSSFDATYQNDVRGLLSGDFFKRPFQYYGTPEGDPDDELFEHLKRRDLPLDVTKRMGVDLAFSVSTRADFTARVTTAEDREGNFYIMRAARTKIDVGHDDWIVEGYNETNGIGLVAIEAVQAQSLVVKQLMRDHPRVPVVAQPADNDKVTRATAVAERWKSHKVWLHASLRDSEFEREHLGFSNPPRGHDDFVDAGGYSMMLGGNSFVFGGVSVRR